MNNNNRDDVPYETPTTWMFWKKRRYVLTLMFFLGFCNVYSLRVNLSVAIVAMTNGKNITTPEGEIIEEPLFVDYSRQQQGVILSSFFYGYICTQILGGLIVRHVSAHIVYGIGIAATSILTLFTPLVAGNFAALVSIRVIEGFFEGVTFPCLHSMLSKWAPPLERTRMNSFAFAGNYIGTVIAMPMSGIIGETLGWEWIFYIFGIVGCCWYAVWLLIIRGSPDTDPWITDEERNYITKSIGSAGTGKPGKTPWKAIWTSSAVWAIICAHFSENWGYYTLLTQLPTFLNDVVGFDLKSAGFASSLPYLTMGLLMGVTGYTADYLISHKIFSTTFVRKLFNCGGFIAQCVFMMAAAYILNEFAIITCLTLGVGLGAFSISGFAVNHLDIAPQYAAILIGITNTFATIPGIVSPLLTGLVVTSNDPDEMKNQWRIVFFVSASIYLFGAVFYWLFCSGELQKWAVNEPDVEKKNRDLELSRHAYDNRATEDMSKMY